jgi:hypothetical protein
MPYTKAFSKLKKNVKEQYLGKEVPKKYQDRYGKFYDKPSEIKQVAYAIARSRGIKIEKGGKI